MVRRLTLSGAAVTLERRFGGMVVTATEAMPPHGSAALHHIATHPRAYLDVMTTGRTTLPDQEVFRRFLRDHVSAEEAVRLLRGRVRLSRQDETDFTEA